MFKLLLSCLSMFWRLFQPVRRQERRLLRAYYTGRIRMQALHCGIGLKVNGPSAVNSHTSLGDNVNFNGLIVNGGGAVHIGNNFHSGPGCLIITQNHNYDGGTAIPYDDTYIMKRVTIGDNVWLGSRVMILGDMRIGEGAIIQAGSVVTSDIPACAIAGGHPARVFKWRDKEHYYKLKEAQKFH